jgi:ankyrin repeat protein
MHVIYDHLVIVKLLILEGDNIHQSNNDGGAPIKVACMYDHLNIVELLLYYDVDMTYITFSNYITMFLILVHMMKLDYIL